MFTVVYCAGCVYVYSRVLRWLCLCLQSCIALVVPNPKALGELAAGLGIKDVEFEQLCSNVAVEKEVLKKLMDVGKKGTTGVCCFVHARVKST